MREILLSELGVNQQAPIHHRHLDVFKNDENCYIEDGKVYAYGLEIIFYGEINLDDEWFIGRNLCKD